MGRGKEEVMMGPSALKIHLWLGRWGSVSDRQVQGLQGSTPCLFHFLDPPASVLLKSVLIHNAKKKLKLCETFNRNKSSFHSSIILWIQLQSMNVQTPWIIGKEELWLNNRSYKNMKLVPSMLTMSVWRGIINHRFPGSRHGRNADLIKPQFATLRWQ